MLLILKWGMGKSQTHLLLVWLQHADIFNFVQFHFKSDNAMLFIKGSFTSDFAVVSICFHYKARLTVTSVRAWSVDA